MIRTLRVLTPFHRSTNSSSSTTCWLYPEQLEAAVDTRYRAQAHPIDYRQRLGAWDSGVVPYQISPDFTDTERQRILAALPEMGVDCAR